MEAHLIGTNPLPPTRQQLSTTTETDLTGATSAMDPTQGVSTDAPGRIASLSQDFWRPRS